MGELRMDFELDEKVDQLAFSAVRLFDEAECILADRYSLAKEHDDQMNREYALQKIAWLRSIRRDYRAAEEAYERWEIEAHNSSLAKSEHAFFLFSILNDHERSLKKVAEVEREIRGKLGSGVVSRQEIQTLFRGLQIKGRSLLRLGRVPLVHETLKDLNRLIRDYPDAQFGFEMDLVEEAVDAGLRFEELRTYLQSARWSSFDRNEFEPRKQEALKRLDS
jgi:hypothetical protein